MGALTKAADTVGNRRRGTPCTVGLALRDLDDEDRGNLAAWAAEALDPDHPRTLRWIEDTCVAAGITLRAQTLSRHYQGRCACDG